MYVKWLVSLILIPSQMRETETVDSLAAVQAARKYLSEVFLMSSALRIGTGSSRPLNHARPPWFASSLLRTTDVSRSSARMHRLSTVLWHDPMVAELVDEALNGKVVDVLFNGPLPREALAGFVAQGKFFHEAFARAYVLVILATYSAACRCGALVSAFVHTVRSLSSNLYRRRWQSSHAKRLRACHP